VAAEFVWWEVQSNNHVFEKGFPDPTSFVFEREGVDGFLKSFPPEDEIHFCPADEAFVKLPIRCSIPGTGVYGIRDHSEIKVGAYPERIVGEDPLVDALMAKPDTQRVQTLLGKAVFWWE